jgi:hypothetical protein
MTKITDMLWLGNSHDAEHSDLKAPGIGALLNVAHDLEGKRGWHDGVEYAQCGLVDGPGNTMASYHAAVLKLLGLTYGGRKALVYCHEGRSQSVAVAIMALQCETRHGWDGWLKIICNKKDEVVTPHAEHRRAFNKLNWRLLTSVLES